MRCLRFLRNARELNTIPDINPIIKVAKSITINGRVISHTRTVSETGWVFCKIIITSKRRIIDMIITFTGIYLSCGNDYTYFDAYPIVYYGIDE
ncbi:MAG: hypothetical protein WHV26_07120 [Spirochaetota bacterium]